MIDHQEAVLDAGSNQYQYHHHYLHRRKLARFIQSHDTANNQQFIESID
jgi:hypothetical protein